MSCPQCELSELLHESMSPDPEMVNPIERAFLAGQIDSQVAELAYQLISQMSTFSTRGIN